MLNATFTRTMSFLFLSILIVPLQCKIVFWRNKKRILKFSLLSDTVALSNVRKYRRRGLRTNPVNVLRFTNCRLVISSYFPYFFIPKRYIWEHIFNRKDFVLFPFLVKYSLMKVPYCLYRSSFSNFETFCRLSRILGRIFYHNIYLQLHNIEIPV